MDLSRENSKIIISKNYSIRPLEPYGYPKKNKSLYKNKQLNDSFKINLESINISKLDLYQDSSKTYPQFCFMRDIDPEANLADTDRKSIISLEDDQFEIVRPASFSSNKPRALYKDSSNMNSKFLVNKSQMDLNLTHNFEVLPAVETQTILEEVKEKVNARFVDKKAKLSKKAIKNVKMIDQGCQTIDLNQIESKIINFDENKNEMHLSEKKFHRDSIEKLHLDEMTKNYKNSLDEKKKSKENSILNNEDTRSEDLTDKQKLLEQKLKLYYPYKLGIGLNIFLFITSIIEIVLQIVLIMNITPLKKASAGIWSGMFGIIVLFSNVLIIIKRNYKLYYLSIVINSIGIAVFIALAVINSITLNLYNSKDGCLPETKCDSQFIGANVALMVLAIISFSFCLLYLLKVRIEINQ
ncbi:unnamed protein product [Brachionus calyciflorus]|uniref:Uncharacterized protein n=1 Tax=Brachionus calyciflorus TaxID=104777 RepID=A0A814A2N8_9BILA|nr:unnamed protein product [Brachionus calyciflorus]